MEALTLETQTEERVLIFSFDQEINRVTQEVQTRLGILNRIFQHKIKSHQLAGITNTPFEIGKFIFELQLQQNEQLKNLHDAGIKVTAELPAHLQKLKDDLMAWHKYKGPSQNKFAFLKVEESSAEIDNEQLENLFVQRQMKVYVEGEQLDEYKQLQMICNYLQEHRAPNNQIFQNSFFNSRIECIGSHQFKPNWRWFREKD